MEIDDRSDYQKWLDSNDTGTPDPEQQAQLDVNQNTLAPEGTNEIDTSLLDNEGVESTPATAEQPATPEEPEQSYGEEATENESVVEQWIGDGLAFIKDAFDDRDYDEIRQEITDNNTKRDDSKNVVQQSLDEIEKIGGNAIAQPLNAVAQVGKLGLDTVGSALGMRGDAPAPWDSAYEGAEFNLVGSKPVTEIGQASATILGFMRNNRILNQVLPGKNASGVQKFARNVGIDAVADMVFSPGKGNLINMAQDTEFLGIGKLMKDTGFLDALAHKDEDNEFIRRLKNGAEGNVIGRSIDGLGLVYKGLREVFKPLGPFMQKKGISYNQLPPQIKEANQIIFDKITALDEFDLKSPEALEATSEFRKTKAKAEVASNTADYQTTNIDRQAAEVSDELAGLKQKVEADTAAKEVEKDALLYKLYKEQTTRLDELAKEVKGDADALAAIEQLKLVDEQIQLDLGSYSNSFTAKLKKPRPMGQTELPLDGFKGTGDIDTPVSKMEADFKSERRQAWKEKFNKLSEAERKPFYERRPGFDERKAEDIANSGTKEQQLYEANERASRTSSFPVRKVAAQQAAMPEFGTPQRIGMGSSDPIMTDAMKTQLNAAQGDTAELVERLMPEEFRAEMDEFRAQNRKDTPENIAKTEKIIERMRDGEEPVGLLHELAEDGGLPMPIIRTIYGDQIARTMINDLALQIREQVPMFQEIKANGGDATRQAVMIIDDLIGVGQEGIRGRSYKGSALNALRTMPLEEFKTRALSGEFDVTGPPDVKTLKKLDEFTSKWEQVKQDLIAGKPDAVEKMDYLSEALVLADGNPLLVQTMAQQALRMSGQNFRTAMYNAYLSSIRTHERNIIGTATNVVLKPLLAAGGSLAKPQQAKDVLSLYSSIFGGFNDAMAAARIQWKKTGDAQVARGYMMQQKNMSDIMDNIGRQAKTPGQYAAAMALRAQYYYMATPARQYATRGMAATDAAWRTISARQSARFDYLAEIAKDQRVFDADELNELIASKFDEDFNIQDPKALRQAKEDTFQADLTGRMAKIDDLIKSGGVFTQLAIPFVRTPTVILGQTPQFMPILPRIAKHTDLGGSFMKEYHAVVNGDDELMKAFYKGREGASYIIGVLGTTMGMHGRLSGSGHYDYSERTLDQLEVPKHSFKWVDGKWYSHRSLGPISTVLSMWADVGYVGSNTHRYDDYNEYFGQAMYSVAGALFDQSWLKGLTAAVGTFEEMVNGRRKFDLRETPDAFLASVMSAFTVYGGALKDFNNMLVPGAREYNSNMERYWASTVPLLKSQLGAEKISPISGNPIVNDGTARTNILTPFSIKDIQESEAVSLLIKYGIDYTLEMNDHYNGVKLGPVDKHNINKLMAKGTTSQGGLEKQLIHWMTSPAFEKMHTDWLEYPTPKKDQEWYTATTALIAKIRKEAVEAYILTKPTEAQELRSRIDQAQKVKIMENARNQQALKKEYEALLELNLP